MPNQDRTLSASELFEMLKRERQEAKADPIGYGIKQAEWARETNREVCPSRVTVETLLGRLLSGRRR